MNRENKKNFEIDFVKGCLAFLTIAATVKGDDRTADVIFEDMMNPIVGNRNRDKLTFEYVMPELFKKVTAYCNEASLLSEEVEANEGDLFNE